MERLCQFKKKIMYKLLPPTEKAIVGHEYALRRTIVSLFAFAIVIALGIASLYPSYAITSARKSDLGDRLNQFASAPTSNEDNDLRAWAADIHKKLVILSPDNDTDKPYELFNSVFASRPSGVKLNGLSWSKKNNKAIISVAGISADRESLLSFEKALNDSKRFKPSAFPVSDLAQDADIPFQFDLIPNL